MNHKIFWGFDAFEDGIKTNIFVGETLGSLNEKLKAEIHPVFTLGAESVDTIPVLKADTINAITKSAEEKMDYVLNKIRIQGILRPEVIVESSYSMSKIVKNFVNYAERNGATLVAVGSHGRKGIERAVLGSFTETLLFQCHLPVLVVGQNFDQIPKWDEILFPTDFSDDSSFAFHKVLDLAKELQSRITIFHHLSPILDPVIQSAMAPFGGVWMSYRDDMDALKDVKERKLKEWSKIAEERGIPVKTFLDTSQFDSSEAILSYVEKNKIGLVTMATQSGPMATTIFGAVTRKVVRQASCPVWLLRRN